MFSYFQNISEGGGLPSIIRNSFPRPAIQRINANPYLPTHQQQQQSPVNQQPQQQQSSQQQQQHYQISNNIKPSTLVYSMHNMHINDDGSGSLRSINSSKSAATTGSESGSSNGSCDERTPPPTPLPMQVCAGMGIVSGYQQQQQQQQPHQQQQQKHHLSYKQQQQLNLQQRLNGRNGVEKSYQQIYTTSNPSDPQSLQQQQQQQALLISPSSVSTPTTTVLLQPQPQQQAPQQPPPTATAYNAATYPYHTASPRGPPHTLLQAHNAPPPQALHGPFRFPLAPPHNGELIYPAYHAGLAFSAVPVTATPTGAPTAVTGGQLRSSSNAVGVVSTNAVAVQTVPPTSQQQQQLLAATVATTPYTTLNVCPITGSSSGVAQKIISCYNCGSQTHSGRDCQEASMEDVTRNATYKLDYSTSTMVNSIGGDSGTEHSKDVGNMLKNATVTTPTAATSAAAVAASSMGK